MPLVQPVPDVHSLDLLHSVAELGSIRQAASRHSISQPGASMRLRSLEQLLGVQLLDRSHGRAQLTSAGTAVVQWSEEVLSAMRELQVGVEALRADDRTHLRVMASMTVAEYLVPGWLNRLRTSDPDLVVSLEMGNSHRVLDAMSAAEADVGFVEGQHAPRDLASRVICADDLVVVVDSTHPWARRRKPLVAAELASCPLVLREAGSGTREVLEAAMRSLGLTVTALVELGSTTAIKAAVGAGVGPGVLSRLAVDDDVRESRLVEVAIEGFSLGRFIRVVWPKERPLSVSAKRLLRQIDNAGGRRFA